MSRQTHYALTWGYHVVLALTLTAVLSACGGGGGGESPTQPITAAQTYTVGGTVTGLTGSSVVLQDNQADNLTVSANGAFTFATALANGSAYGVTVLTQPAGQTCTVTQGNGALSGANVSNVQVVCAAQASAHLAFMSAAQTVNAGASSGAVQVSAFDSAGALVPLVNVALSSSSATMKFSASADFSTAITNLSLTSGTGTIYFLDTAIGTPTITATASGYVNGAQSQTIKATIAGTGTLTRMATLPAPTMPLIQGSDGNFYGVVDNGGYGQIFRMAADGALTTLHTYSGVMAPSGPLVQASDGNFYGTTGIPGTASDSGTVFRITPNGQYTTLYSFTGQADGKWPQGGLIQGKDGTLYGTTTFGGGTSDCGTAYSISLTGNFTVLHAFDLQTEGCRPFAGVIQASDGVLYGTLNLSARSGSIFKMSTTGSLNILHQFVGTDGSYPAGALIEGSDGNLYGTTSSSGPTTASRGTVFKITKSGALSTLYAFQTNTQGTHDGYLSSGTSINGTLIQLSDGNLYGTTPVGGANACGAIYQITPFGSETVIYSFAGSLTGDGCQPFAALLRASNGSLYGVAKAGSPTNAGTIFRFTGATP